ncbi:MAG: hypothetical protein A2806_04395 [Candidatus Terrybacteria bacterium RIFCSPHIGHO2_01_FULL_48_17]|uniref:PAS domain-containing protein n=1 Tax=Candidatus Terrybacteria bacterium RIFCSPHIGHO2_01_FULL_48_17 TaxID=1802362 RepID=A0A1G2PKM4_9BACT|nr:MAG: hypothetical protein A2806_04395 [Candidatus Terrybacteria bacterium RIFCSPHIGHO2_01_FULL_48_17]OHA52860.1 MAG: hypothetical protein A3A30_03120 [Candidatus Terrybacteria bacterium RIFCSPLOWO2_01_FULL_48_14]
MASVLFMFFVACLALWAFDEGLTRLAATEDATRFWANRASTGWIFMAPIFFHFALALTRREKIAQNPAVIAALYFPAAIFYFINLSTTLLLNEHYKQVPWGWDNSPPTPLFNLVFSPWLEFFFIASIILFLRERARKTATYDEKRRASLIAAGLFVPLFTGTISQIILPALGIEIVGLTTTFMPVLALSVFIAIVRHRLFIVTPSLALDTVLETMNDAIVVTDTIGRIQFINKTAETLFFWKNDDIAGYDLSILFPSNTNHHSRFVTDSVSRLMQGEFVDDFETIFVDSQNRQIPVTISAAPVQFSEEGFEPAGFVLVAHDTRELQLLTGKLKRINDALRAAKGGLESELGVLMRGKLKGTP